MTPAHVCFVAPGSFPSLVPGTGSGIAGGAEIQQAQLMRVLAADGFCVSLLSHDFGQPERCVVDGINVHRLPGHEGRSVKGLGWLTPRLTDVVAQLNQLMPDVVYVRTMTAYLMPAAWFARRHQRRLVYAAASDLDFRPGRKPLLSRRDAALFRLGLRGVDTFVLQNQTQMALLQQNHGKQGVVVPNVHTESDAGQGAFDGPVLWVGTVTPHKRPELFVELAASLPHRRFVMVGGPGATPDARAYFDGIARSAAALTNLRFSGFVPPAEVGRQFDGASVLVNTSAAEGFPNTFLQAWLRGVPSASFVRPEVADGLSYTLACDNVADMSQRVEALLTSEQRWLAQSQLCAQALQLHHAPAAVLPLYRQLLGASHAD
jgi:glycosyltransferase involved in cell wall biosynthesis